MTQHLLATKIQVPPLSPRTVTRTRLLAELDRGLQPNVRVTLISAPAGYGKTTLLADWLQNRDLAAAWFSLSEGDNDPTRFITYLIAAVEKLGAVLELPSVGDQIAHEEFKGRFLIPLINQIGRLSKQTVALFDDYHLIHNQVVHDQIEYLIENLPPQAHVYIASRADPPLAIARLRGRGQVNELRMQDLRFRQEETETFLNLLSKLRLSADDLNTLQRRTEGWICGLQMAAVFLREQEDVQAFIQGFSGSHYYIVDYLLDEVLRREPPEMQTFLLQTSILERLSGPLCDAVCGVTSQTHSSSRQLLRKLEQANLFIVPLDERREWYRYHRLFSDLLQARLEDEETQRIPILHRRASAWFAANDFTDDAVQHALLAGDDAYAADLVEKYAQEILLRSETTTFLNWVQRLPDEQIQKRSKLGIYRAWALFFQGAPLRTVEAQIKASREAYGPPGSSRSLEALILLAQGEVDQALQLAEEALALLPADEIFLRDHAAICAAGCRISLGDVEGGIQLMDRLAQKTRRTGNRTATVAILCELAELRQKQLRVDAAAALYEQALELSKGQDGSDLPVAGRPLIGLGSIALERYELELALRLLLDGIQLAERWSLISTMDGYLSLVMLYDASGEDVLLEEALLKLDDLCQRFDASEFDDIVVDLLKAKVHLRRGDLPAARQWVIGRDLMDVPPQRPRVGSVAYRIHKYELAVLARWHIAETRYQDALDTLQELANLATQAGRPYLLVEATMLRAKTYHLLGEPESALETMKDALVMAAPTRMCRIFLTEGDDVIQILRAVQSIGDEPAAALFVNHMLAIIDVPSDKSAARSLAAGESLSPRELEVLRLLPSGLSAVELADELVISANTLRSHLKNIYAKLGVHSRHEAVAKATQLDLF